MAVIIQGAMVLRTKAGITRIQAQATTTAAISVDSCMIKVKEIYVGRAEQDITRKVISATGEELDLHIPRDTAIDLMPQIFTALDTKEIHKPLDVH
jgi:hypothetical protein